MKLESYEVLGTSSTIAAGRIAGEHDIGLDIVNKAISLLVKEGIATEVPGDLHGRSVRLRRPENLGAALEAVRSVRPGNKGASAYHEAIEHLFTEIFCRYLTRRILDRAEKEHPVHGGRKRVDITYRNVATEGFFAWLRESYHAPYVLVECKNYDSELGNDEFDQLAGRFSTERGQIGLLVFRKVKDKARALERCLDTARDNRGFILLLDDNDLTKLVADREGPHWADFPLLWDRFEDLVMNRRARRKSAY